MATAPKIEPTRPATPRNRAGAEPRRGQPDSADLFTTLARTGLFLEALQRECFAEHGLTFTEYSVLRLLSRTPRNGLAPSVLAEEIVCTTGAMTKIVDRLARNELVLRRADPNDRRGVRVEITRKGSRLSDKAAKSYKSGRKRVLDRLGEPQAASIHDHLSRLLEALEDDRQTS